MSEDQPENVTPIHQPQADPMGGDRMLDGMVEFITGKIPAKLLPAEDREHACQDFVVMLGRLVEFIEQFKPLTTPQMAALLFFFESLNLNRLGDDPAFVVMTMVDAAKNAARKMRREAKEGA